MVGYTSVLKAELLGGHRELVTDTNEIRPAIERAFEGGKPSCVNIDAEEHARASTVSFGGTSTLMSRD
jgi:thiamine pyrophosphate-dependent acetolactate synthase large subunit-like protein